jgi:hypothetical protein
LKRRLARLGRQILKIFDFGIADNGGFDIYNCAAKIAGELIVVSGGALGLWFFRGIVLS